MRISRIWFREYVQPPGRTDRVQTLETFPAYECTEDARGILLAAAKGGVKRLYPWASIAWIDYAQN